MRTMSYFVMGGKPDAAGLWMYTLDAYPKPDLMTHPASTGLLMCQGAQAGEGGTSAWVLYKDADGTVVLGMLDPHAGESNVTFADGHTETLREGDMDETMWMSMWERP